MNSIEIKAKIAGGLMSFVGRLPLGALYKLGGFASWVFNKVLHYRKTEVYVNLSRSFPDFSYQKIRETADGYYRHLGEIVAETIWFGGCKGRPERLRKQNLYEFPNIDLLLDIRKERGVLCMRSHMGNWEVAGGVFEYNHDTDMPRQMTLDDFFVSYRPMANKVSDLMFYNNRCAVIPGFKGMVKDTNLLRHIIKHKDRNPVYMLIADQYPYLACHHVGTFLNQPTEGMLGAFELAHKLGLAVLYVGEERKGRGHYSSTLQILSKDASDDKPEDMMRKYYDLLEADIRKDPANWLWSHRRWHY